MAEGLEFAQILQVVGYVGVFLYLASYAALQLGFLTSNGYAYPVINFFAASCVLTSLMDSFNLSSALIQIFWILISIVGVIRLYFISQRLVFSPEERRFMETSLQGLPKLRARKLLDIGVWLDLAQGTIITEEEKPVPHLTYIAGGTAAVTVGGKKVATVGEDAIIGEVTYMTGAPATATVTAAAAVRALRFDAEMLRAFLSRHPDISSALEQNMAHHLRAKLKAANEAAASKPQAA